MKQRKAATSGNFFHGTAAARVKRGSRRFRAEQGSSLVEYAFVVLIFMSMVLGIMDFGRALYSYHFVSHAAREATRWAAVNGSTCSGDSSCDGAGTMNSGPATPTDIQNYVANMTPAGIDSTKITTTATWLRGNGPAVCNTAGNKNAPGCTVEVKVSYRFNFLFPVVHSSAITLSSSSEMVVAH